MLKSFYSSRKMTEIFVSFFFFVTTFFHAVSQYLQCWRRRK